MYYNIITNDIVYMSALFWFGLSGEVKKYLFKWFELISFYIM